LAIVHDQRPGAAIDVQAIAHALRDRCQPTLRQMSGGQADAAPLAVDDRRAKTQDMTLRQLSEPGTLNA
jgi:hypothetical protein